MKVRAFLQFHYVAIDFNNISQEREAELYYQYMFVKKQLGEIKEEPTTNE